MFSRNTLPDYIWFLTFFCLLILFQSIVWYFAGTYPPWGDEIHFVETVRYFGQEFSWKKLIHYNEMSSPLPFVMYAAWGKLVGFELNNLRALSILIAIPTYLSFYIFISNVFKDQRIAWCCTMFLMFHPYMVGFSTFVFTDMIPISASIMVLYAMYYKKPWLILLAGIIGLLSRQYFVFLLIAAGFTYFVRLFHQYNRKDFLMTVALVGSTLPFIILVYFWNGLSPKNQLNHLYLDQAFRFHPNYLTLYLIQLSVYLFPLVLVNYKKIYIRPLPWIISLASAWLYWIFPVEPCPAAVLASYDTVGFFHKFLKLIIAPAIEQPLFFTLLIISIPILIFIVNDICNRFRNKTYDLIFSLHLSVICFLVIMPFSYLLWEKYFMPLVPLLTLTWAAFYRVTDPETDPPLIKI